ncbi:MAG: hypothetical protein JRJ45_08000 [Deltaproteobacteria bacterium]|nr:hypothetical protein [Deltaproteobacteria bacterium]
MPGLGKMVHEDYIRALIYATNPKRITVLCKRNLYINSIFKPKFRRLHAYKATISEAVIDKIVFLKSEDFVIPSEKFHKYFRIFA